MSISHQITFNKSVSPKGYNIRARHNFLADLIGTKTEEDLSLRNMNQLLAALTICMLTFSALEAGFYFMYNKKV